MKRFWVAVPFIIYCLPVLAGDPQFWGHYSAEIHEWFPQVMQPGFENASDVGHSCCGVGDDFEARTVGEDTITGDILIIINDGKGVLPDGLQVHVPRAKIQTKYGNPIGKLIVFIGSSLTVYCLLSCSVDTGVSCAT